MNQQMAGKVYAGYFQFYLFDADAMGDTGSDAFWTKDANAARLAVIPGALGISTNTYGEVPVTLTAYDAAPPLPDADQLDADHLVEASLTLTQGNLIVRGCPDEPTDLSLQLPAGTYRVRVASQGLQNGDSQTEYNGDQYHIALWSEASSERVVLKQFA
jgi:hypothetical protein